MMTEVQDILQTLCSFAPLELQMDFDNSGFLVGRADAPVSRALLALDVTDAVIEEAVSLGAELIISHHPVIFHPLRAVTDQSPEGRRIIRLLEKGISVISMHTNLDIAQGGVNDILIEKLGAEAEAVLDESGCGRIGVLPAPMPLEDFLRQCKGALSVEGLRYVDAGRPVYRLAVIGGSGADSISRAASLGCDTFVTADVKYHQFQAALDCRLNLIDADHFCTENPVLPSLLPMLQKAFPDVVFTLSSVHKPLIRFA